MQSGKNTWECKVNLTETKKSAGNLVGFKDNVLYASVTCEICARDTKINKLSSKPGLEGKQTSKQSNNQCADRS